MKTIPLTQGKVALIDDEWFEYLSQYKWGYYKGGYAARQTQRNRVKATIYMHRLIANTPKGYDTDHINGDKLDNRSSNLRVVTHHENLSAYMKLDKRNTSGYRGVAKWKNKWRARIGRSVYLGVYDTPELAHEAILRYKEETQ